MKSLQTIAIGMILGAVSVIEMDVDPARNFTRTVGIVAQLVVSTALILGSLLEAIGSLRRPEKDET